MSPVGFEVKIAPQRQLRPCEVSNDVVKARAGAGVIAEGNGEVDRPVCFVAVFALVKRIVWTCLVNFSVIRESPKLVPSGAGDKNMARIGRIDRMDVRRATRQDGNTARFVFLRSCL